MDKVKQHIKNDKHLSPAGEGKGVRPGYKNSPLGMIPVEWEVKELAHFGEIYSGGTPDTGNENFWNGEINWCTPTDITALNGSKYIGETEIKISSEGLKNSSAKLLPVGSIIVCTRATIGKVAISSKEISTNQGFKNIIPNKIVSVDFLYYTILNSQIRLLRLGNGSTFLEIPKSDFEKFQILLPPLPEQTAIANLLSTWDKAIQASNALIVQKELRKKWLMQQLLTGKKRLKGFSGEWKEYRIGDVFDFVKSYSFSREYLTYKKTEGGIYYIHYGDIHAVFENDVLDLDKQDRLPFLKKEFTERVEFVFLQDGDTVVADASEDYEGVGESVEIKNINDKQVIAGLHTIVLRDKIKKTTDSFRAFLFNGETTLNKFRKIATGSSVYGISKSGIAAVKIFLPSTKEQTAIASILLAADKELQLLRTKVEYLKEQKKWLMQVLLTGKKRLKIDNI